MISLETNPAFLNPYIQDNSIVKRYNPAIHVGYVEYVYWLDLIPVIQYIKNLQQDVGNIWNEMNSNGLPGGLQNVYAITSLRV